MPNAKAAVPLGSRLVPTEPLDSVPPGVLKYARVQTEKADGAPNRVAHTSSSQGITANLCSRSRASTNYRNPCTPAYSGIQTRRSASGRAARGSPQARIIVICHRGPSGEAGSFRAHLAAAWIVGPRSMRGRRSRPQGESETQHRASLQRQARPGIRPSGSPRPHADRRRGSTAVLALEGQTHSVCQSMGAETTGPQGTDVVKQRRPRAKYYTREHIK